MREDNEKWFHHIYVKSTHARMNGMEGVLLRKKKMELQVIPWLIRLISSKMFRTIQGIIKFNASPSLYLVALYWTPIAKPYYSRYVCSWQNFKSLLLWRGGVGMYDLLNIAGVVTSDLQQIRRQTNRALTSSMTKMTQNYIGLYTIYLPTTHPLP